MDIDNTISDAWQRLRRVRAGDGMVGLGATGGRAIPGRDSVVRAVTPIYKASFGAILEGEPPPGLGDLRSP